MLRMILKHAMLVRILRCCCVEDDSEGCYDENDFEELPC